MCVVQSIQVGSALHLLMKPAGRNNESVRPYPHSSESKVIASAGGQDVCSEVCGYIKCPKLYQFTIPCTVLFH